MLTTYKTTLTLRTQLTSDIFLFRFQLTEPKEIAFKAGQYLILKIGDKSRLYSIASPDFQKNSFELLVQIIPGGLASTYLSNLKVGNQAIFQGPAGLFTLRETGRDKIFLATGTGIAPIRSMLLSVIASGSEAISSKIATSPSAPRNDNDYHLFWGIRHFSDIYFLDEFRNLKLKIKNFDFYICLSREQNLEIIPAEDRKYFMLGHVNNGFEREIENFDYYLCGSRDVVESLRQYLHQKGVPKEQVFFEKF